MSHSPEKPIRGRQIYRSILVAALALVILWLGNAHAAGLLIADGGFGGVLEIKSHEVQVTVNNGVAVTQVTQVFHNTENRQVEALYTFPVPKGASVSNFSMWINGKEMVGEVLEKKRAREIYDSYKRKRQDPGLLEQVDYKTFEMRIFPIGPKADQRVMITYYQELDIDHDRATYVYPLATAAKPGLIARTTGKFSIGIHVKSAVPIDEIGSPSHTDQFAMADYGPHYRFAALETGAGALDKDVVLSYHMTRPNSGVDLVASHPENDDGYFLLSVMAGDELAGLNMGMDYVFLLDISGSMGDDGKLVLSRNSVSAFVHELSENDRFEVITFNVVPDLAFGRLQTALPEARNRAMAYMENQYAKGGTVLAPAMTTAYKYADPDRPLNVVILSDGMTKQAERRELMQLIESRPGNARVFCIGVGNEVNRPLLSQMAEESGGLSAFISHGDNFQRQAKAFRRKLMHPAVSDISLQFKGLQVYDIQPERLQDLYHGAPVRIYGRYKGGADAELILSGNIRGKNFQQKVSLPFPREDDANPEIERMWALKQVDALLKAGDRQGSRQSVVDDIVRLGEAYAIVTEYTSFLVLENDAEYQRWKIERRNAGRLSRDRRAQTDRERQLEIMRTNALSHLGPEALKSGHSQPESKTLAAAPVSSDAPAPVVRNLGGAPQPPGQQPSRNTGRDLSFGTGSGPVGPVLIGLALWLRRKRRKV
ncbi:MAG: VWA domain-containing protein [Desulfobacteraceae bacterium]|nr:VWA domain-containing protein [Desulfobacteraceae bacterium]